MKELTKKQKHAIDLRDSDILVSAAAGAGKTSTLIGRIVDLIIKDGVDINKMLIVTFTQAAASEMRQRLGRRIGDILAEDMSEQKGNPAGMLRLRKQLSLLPVAQMSTIHAFCSEILRNNFQVVGISPDFRIAEQNEVAILRAEALDESLDEFYNQNAPDFIELAVNLTDHKSDNALRTIIDDVYEFTRSLPEPKQWLQDQIDTFTLNDSHQFAAWQAILLKRWRDDVQTAAALYENALEICSLSDGPVGRIPMFEKEKDSALTLRICIDKGWDECIAAIRSAESFGRLSAAKKDCDRELVAMTKSLRDSAKSLLSAIYISPLAMPSADLQASVRRQAAQVGALVRVVCRYDEVYQAKKLKKGILDFSDLEHLTLQVLQQQQVAEELSASFEYIFVDEYQDTNLVQEAIIAKLKRPGRLFMVGDIKQSIYRFRNADPGIFLEKYRRFNETGANGGTRIDFSENHRSTKNIISFVNFVFSSIMSQRLGEIDYDDSARLFCGARNEEASLPVEIYLVQKDDNSQAEENEDEAQGQLAGKARHTEVEMIADRINAMVGTEFVPDTAASAAGVMRLMRFSDIAILIRSPRSLVEQYVEVFTSKGIPLFVDGGGGFFETYETRILLSLLELLDNFRQDIPLLSVLRSPVCGFSDTELALVRAASPGGCFYDAFTCFAAQETASQLQDKVASFLEDYAKWRLDASIYPLDELIWNIMVQTGLYAIVGAMPEGDRRQANLRLMLEKARKTQQSGLRGVYDFVRLNHQILERGDDFEPAKLLSENDNVVRLMSVHKSKGLEFPCVIVAGLGKMMNRRDQYKALVMHKSLGFGPYEYFHEGLAKKTTLPREAAIARMDDEFLSEEMRILYVALTRARDRLILAGTLKKQLGEAVAQWCKPLMPGVLSRVPSLLDWIGMIIVRHKDCAPVLDTPCVIREELPAFDSSIKLSVIGAGLKIEDEVALADEYELESEVESDKQCEEALFARDQVQHILAWEYMHEHATRIPAKLSVSQIKKMSQQPGAMMAADNAAQLVADEADDELPPLISVKDESVDSAEIGTAVHLLLSRVWDEDYRTHKDLQNGLALLIDQGMIRKEVAAKVNLRKVGDFLLSSIAQNAFTAERIYTERHFNLLMQPEEIGFESCASAERVMVQGVIDLYYVNAAGKAVLVDFKTDSVIRAGGVENIIQRYHDQLGIYRKAIERLDGIDVAGAYLYLIDTGETVEVTID